MAGLATAVMASGTGVIAADNDPRYAAYLSMSFGQSQLPKQFHYGLRLDQDAWQATYGASVLPPLLQVEVSGERIDTRLQGLSLSSYNYRLNQVETGILASLGTAGTAAAVAATAAVVVVVADSGGSDSPPPDDGGGTPTGGGTTGGSPAGGGTTGGGTPTGGFLGVGYTSLRTPGAAPFLGRDRSVDPEHQRWLDGGTGQMGDLH